MASIRKRIGAAGGVTWQAQIRRRGDQFFGRTFKRKKDAEAWANKAEHRLARGATGAELNASRMTLDALIDEYLNSLTAADGRIRRAKGQVNQLNWWRQRYGRVEIGKIKIALLEDALQRLEHEKGSNATVNRYRAVISHVLTFAARRGYIEQRPMFPPQLREQPRGRVLTAAEQPRLLLACERWPELHAMVQIALLAGTRAGELTQLEWSDVHVDQGHAVLRNTKNGTDRRLPLLGPILVAIKAMQVRRLLDPREPRVFRGVDYRRAWEKARAAAGIEDFRFHDLRHTAITRMVESGASPFDVATVAGHKTPHQTWGYTHPSNPYIDSVLQQALGNTGHD